MLSKKIIFLTGATGTMGEEGLKQILSRSDRFNLRVLVRPSAKNKAFMSMTLRWRLSGGTSAATTISCAV